MWWTRIFALAVLFATADARPEGYGVKGVGHYRPSANGVASAYASAHATAGGLGVAKSSASATATANASGGGASNADAIANASFDGGNSGEAIEKANGNVNERTDNNDDLHRRSNNRGGVAEYKFFNREDGTAGSSQRNTNAAHVVSDADNDNSGRTGQNHENRGCIPDGVKGHGRADRTRCNENKPVVADRNPARHEDFHSSTGSQHSVGNDAGYSGNRQKPGMIDRSHAASPCIPGDSECFAHKPSVANSHPTYIGNPDLSAGSSSSAGIDGGYGGNSQKPGTIGGSHSASPCAPADSKCFAHKPSVANPHPTYMENPDLSAGSSSSAGIDGGYGGNSQKPGTIGGSHSASPCAPGDSKCFAHKPSVSNPYPTNMGNFDLSAGSSSPAGIDGGYGGNRQKPGTIGGSHSASPCASGDSNCFANKPSVANPYPTYVENPDLSAGSSSPPGIDGGYGGNSQKPGTIGGSHSASPCASGDSKCFAHKPSVANPHPTYMENPDLSAGSSSSAGIDGGYGGNRQKPGTIGGSHSASPCASGDSNCFAHKPSVANPYPTYMENPDLSAGSSSSAGIDGGYEGNRQKPGTIGGSHSASPCASGDSKCFPHKPSVANPYPTYMENPDLSAGSSSSAGIDGGYEGNRQKPGTIGGSHSASPCASGDSKCFAHKPSVANPYPTYMENPDLSAGSSSSAGIDGGYGVNSLKPGTIGGSHSASPCAPGDSNCFAHKPSVTNPHSTYNGNPDTWISGSKYPTNFDDQSSSGKASGNSASSGNKPQTSNPFLNGEIDLSSIKNPSSSGESSAIKPNPSNPFLNPQVRPPTGSNHPSNPTGNNGVSIGAESHHPQGGSSGNSGVSHDKPKPPNPFLTHHGKVDSTTGIKRPTVTGGPQQNDKFPNIAAHPVNNDSPNHDCGSQHSTGIDTGYEGPTRNSQKPGTIDVTHAASPCAFGDSKCFAHRPSVTNPHSTYNGNSDGGSDSIYPTNFNGDYSPVDHRPSTLDQSSSDKPPGHSVSTGNKPGTTNPFLNGEIDLSAIKNPSNSAVSAVCHGTTCSTSKPSKGPSVNPFLTNNPKIDVTAGSESGSTERHKQPSESNPFLVDGKLAKPHSQAPSHGTSIPRPDGPFSTNSLPVHNHQTWNERKPEIVQGCGIGIASASCNTHGNLADKDVHSSVTEGREIEVTSNGKDYGVKGHQAGIKGASHHRGHPIRLQDNLGNRDIDHSGDRQKTTDSTANASAEAHAHASSSSYGAGQSSGSAKSEAYSSLDSGSGKSWSSSSASASAFASSSSSSNSYHEWGSQVIPQVPAE